MQNVRNLPDGILHEGVHLRFRQVRIFPVKAVLALKVEIGDVLPPVFKGVGAEFLHKVIVEAHSSKIHPESPEAGMIPEVLVV